MAYDADRLKKNKSDILAARDQIERLTALGDGAFLADSRNVLAVKYLWIQAVEAISDTCQHLLARGPGVACEGYADCIVKAGKHGLIPAALSNKLRGLADLRNHLVHRYWIIDDERLLKLCRENLEDLRAFADEVDHFLRHGSAGGESCVSR